MKKRSAKQIVALIAVILLAALYIVTLLVAIFDRSASGRWFALSLVCTVAVPLLAWIFIWLYGQYTGKKTIADLNLMQDPEGAEATEQEEADVEETDTQADGVDEADTKNVEI